MNTWSDYIVGDLPEKIQEGLDTKGPSRVSKQKRVRMVRVQYKVSSWVGLDD